MTERDLGICMLRIGELRPEIKKTTDFSLEGRTNIAETNVGEGNLCIGALSFDSGRVARLRVASPTSNTGLGGISTDGVIRVEPQHVCKVVIPKGHDKNHTLCHSLAHVSKTTVLLEAWCVTESLLLSITEVSGDRIEIAHARDVGLGVLNDTSILNIQAANLRECAGSGIVVSEELSDNCEWTGCVDCHSRAVEVLNSHTEGVKVTTVRVAETVIAALNGTILSSAPSLSINVARVRCKGCSIGVCFPNIHLVATSTEVTSTSIRVTRRRNPSLGVGLWSGMSVLVLKFKEDEENLRLR